MTPACLYKKGTLAMNELQQQELQVYGNNWVRNIARLTRRAAELREEGRMTRWRPMLRWEACKERCEEGRRGGRLEEEEKRRREEKLSDEAGWRSWGGGSTSNTLTKGKIGRERIYYVYGLL